MQPIVIIGSGLAGYTVARELRKLNADFPITLICADNGDFYSKPMLSNALHSGKTPAQLVTTAAAAMAQQLNLTLMAHTLADKIDTQGKRVYTNQGSFAYASLVLAVGAQTIPVALEGDAAADVLTVNHLDDYAAFYQHLGVARHIVLIGGGLIGCEFANDLVTGGHRVTVVHPHHFPLQNLLPETVGNALAAALQAVGVTWKFRATVTAVAKDPLGYRVTLSNGEQLIADVVLSAIGLRPQKQLAQRSDIVVRRGVVVDDYLRTSASDIYAIGDCAEYGERTLPYVLPIMNAARALVKTLTGEPTPVRFPYMPVAIKTPALPLLVQLPASDATGQWQVEDQHGLKMLFVDRQGQMLGFVLAGERTKERAQCLAKLPPLVQ
ncbi:MAG: FAD-dependent oxidoreductase [Pseudomonadota bacterium]